jgi:hypothetical protein
MKNLKLYFAAVFVTVFALACQPEDDFPAIDENAPEIIVETPEMNQTFSAGGLLELVFEVRDDSDLDSVAVEIPWIGREVIFIPQGVPVYSYAEVFNIPLDQEAGEYLIQIFALDSEGNIAQEIIPIIIEEAENAENMVTLRVTSVPPGTPSVDNIYLMGNFNNWSQDNDEYRLTRMQDGTYFISLERDENFPVYEFWFTRGDVRTVEQDAQGQEVRRTYDWNQTRNRLMEYEIEKWADNPGQS